MEDRHACKVVERSDAAIDPCEAIDFVSAPGYGGIDVFIGKVRDLNHGRPVLGISYDAPDSHKAFTEKYKLPFTLLSDSKKSVSKLYSADGMLMPKRMTFLIDAEGKIMHVFDSVKTDGHAAQIMEVVKPSK